MIYDYTSGYPFLVSRICQIMDEGGLTWDREGVLASVNHLLKEHNTLFDDMEKKVSQFPTLAETLKAIIFGGKRVSFNYYDRDLNIAIMFNFVKEYQGATLIYCRIFETWLYNLFISNAKDTSIYQQGEYDKPRLCMMVILTCAYSWSVSACISMRFIVRDMMMSLLRTMAVRYS